MTPGLELIFSATAALDPPLVVGATPQGARRVVPIAGGQFEGPALRGAILPGGADWQFTRADGVTELEALYLLRTDDGVLIQARNRGLRHGPEAVMRRLAAGESVDEGEYYFRAAPSFSAPQGKYDWLNRNLFLCAGARLAAAVQLRFYRVT
jgi:hypothetical protein